MEEARVGPPAAPGTPNPGLSFRDRTRAYAGSADEVQGRGRRVSVDERRAVRAVSGSRRVHGAREPGVGGIDLPGSDRPRRATASTGRWRGSASPKRRRATGQYDQAIKDIQGAVAAERRTAAGRRHPDAARTHVSGRRQAHRSAADVHASGRGISGVAVHRAMRGKSSTA